MHYIYNMYVMISWKFILIAKMSFK